MKTGQERKAYWNDKYYQYWKSRVDEAGGNVNESQIIKGDAKTEDDAVYEKVFAEYPFAPGKLLEVGCAWGRMFPIYKQYGLDIYGVDISRAMIDAARKACEGDPQIKQLQDSEAERIPFDDAFFDNVACIATFDATFQHESLKELLRVLKTGHRLYFTGKGDRYHTDDRQALDAETGARSKGHPNFFTDVPKMIEQLQTRKHRIIASWYYPRRGDFARNHFAKDMPDCFYEWFLIIEKGSDRIDFEPFADDHSRTFLELESLDK